MRFTVWIHDGFLVDQGLAVLFTDEPPFAQVLGPEERPEHYQMTIGSVTDSLRWLRSSLKIEIGDSEELLDQMWTAFTALALRLYFGRERET